MQKKTYRVKDLAEMLSMGESTIWKLCSDKNSNFPQPIKITSIRIIPPTNIFLSQTEQSRFALGLSLFQTGRLNEAINAVLLVAHGKVECSIEKEALELQATQMKTNVIVLWRWKKQGRLV
jgi:hypothetical protein